MAFIISKKSRSNGKERQIYYLVENYREGKAVKRRTLLALVECKSTLELFEAIQRKERRLQDRLNQFQRELEEFITLGKMPPFAFGSAFRARRQLDGAIERAKTDLKQVQEQKAAIKVFL